LLGKIKDIVSGWFVRDSIVDGALIDAVQFAARVLNIFEGAAEIQAQVIARGLLASQK
jgi:alkylation response protein AidB-like acyl-CoA dehydrogenase